MTGELERALNAVCSEAVGKLRAVLRRERRQLEETILSLEHLRILRRATQVSNRPQATRARQGSSDQVEEDSWWL